MTATLTQLATSSRSGMSVSQEESLSKSLSDLVGEDVNQRLEGAWVMLW